MNTKLDRKRIAFLRSGHFSDPDIATRVFQIQRHLVRKDTTKMLMQVGSEEDYLEAAVKFQKCSKDVSFVPSPPLLDQWFRVLERPKYVMKMNHYHPFGRRKESLYEFIDIAIQLRHMS